MNKCEMLRTNQGMDVDNCNICINPDDMQMLYCCKMMMNNCESIIKSMKMDDCCPETMMRDCQIIMNCCEMMMKNCEMMMNCSEKMKNCQMMMNCCDMMVNNCQMMMQNSEMMLKTCNLSMKS